MLVKAKLFPTRDDVCVWFCFQFQNAGTHPIWNPKDRSRRNDWSTLHCDILIDNFLQSGLGRCAGRSYQQLLNATRELQAIDRSFSCLQGLKYWQPSLLCFAFVDLVASFLSNAWLGRKCRSSWKKRRHTAIICNGGRTELVNGCCAGRAWKGQAALHWWGAQFTQIYCSHAEDSLLLKKQWVYLHRSFWCPVARGSCGCLWISSKFLFRHGLQGWHTSVRQSISLCDLIASAFEKVYSWQIRALKAQLNKGDKPWRDEAANLIRLLWCETQSLRRSSCDPVRRSRSAMQKSLNCKKQSGAQLVWNHGGRGRHRTFNAESLGKDWCDCIFVLSSADYCLVFSSSDCLFCHVLCATFHCRCYVDVLSGVVLVVTVLQLTVAVGGSKALVVWWCWCWCWCWCRWWWWSRWCQGHCCVNSCRLYWSGWGLCMYLYNACTRIIQYYLLYIKM